MKTIYNYNLNTITGNKTTIQLLANKYGNKVVSWDFPVKPNETVVGTIDLLSCFNIENEESNSTPLFINHEHKIISNDESWCFNNDEYKEYNDMYPHDRKDTFHYLEESYNLIIDGVVIL
jgi:hypothetical protein